MYGYLESGSVEIEYIVLFSPKQKVAITEHWHIYLFILYCLFNITFSISTHRPIVSNGITSCEYGTEKDVEGSGGGLI